MSFWVIKYIDKRPGYDNGEWRPDPNKENWKVAYYSSTQHNGATLFATRGKASARLKTHFKGGYYKHSEAKVIEVKLVEVENDAIC